MSAIVKPAPSRQASPGHLAIAQGSVAPVRSRHQRQQLTPQPHFSQPIPFPVSTTPKTVNPFPVERSRPAWLQGLMVFQQSFTLITLSLSVATLAVYSWTVYSQQLWGKEYDRLETLQRNERQLMTANEALKNQMAEQAETTESGLILPNSENTIFLQSAPSRSVTPPTASTPKPAPAPLGY